MESSFEITITNIKTPQNEYCKSAHETPYISCGATSITDCKKCQNNLCSSIQCGKEIENPSNYIDKFETYNELCLPRNISDKRKKSMCKNFNGVNTYRIFYECDYNFKYNFSFKTSDFYLSIVIIILIVALIVIYYNNYLIRKKQQPFNVPAILPEALFPNDNNIKNDYQKMRTENNNQMAFTGNYYNI